MWCKRLERDAFADAAVVAKSRSFHWVEVNRDHTPEIPKRFNVSAYPSLVTLGKKQEKVHRFSGYRKAPALIEQLDEALKRRKLYDEGKEWDTPNPRPETICAAEHVEIETFKAPSEEVPAGLAFLGDQLWIAQLGKLYRFGLEKGEPTKEFELSRSVLDICTDGKVIYAMESGWTAGKPIHVIDPETGATVRSIVTEANKAKKSHGAKGIVFRKGSLWVLAGMRGILHEVDIESGDVKRTIQTPERWIAGLDADERHFYAGSRDHLFAFDAETGALAWALPVNYPVRSVAHRAKRFYLMEQPIFGFDKEHERIRVWPTETLVHRLTLRAREDKPSGK